jgi:hypothetical protein
MALHRRILIGLMLASCGAWGLCVPAAASAAPQPNQMSLAAGSAPVVLTASAPVQGGDVVTTWTGDGLVVKAAGAPGSVLSVTKTGTNSAVVSVTPPAGSSDSSEAYDTAGRSVYWDALAVGDSAAQAATAARSAGVAVPGVTSTPTSTALTAASSIFNSACASIEGDKVGDFDVIDGQSCLVQSWLQTGSGTCGCWYSANTITSTGYSISGDQNITQLQGWYCYCNGYTYTRVAWAPAATRSEGNPTTYTLSATYGGFGASVSETQYPQTLAPYFPNGENEAAFGSTWNGSNDNYTYDAANSVAIVHTGVGSPGAATDWVGIGWD